MFILSKGQPKTFNPLMQPNKRAGELYDYTAKLKKRIDCLYQEAYLKINHSMDLCY